MLDDSQHSWRYKARSPDHSAGAGHLADLDRGAGAADLDCASGLGRLDDVLTRGACARVHQNLYEITFCHALFMPKFGSIQAFLG
jgi:hypothetical protein